MHQKEWELRDRTARFSRAVSSTCAQLPQDGAALKLGRRVSIASTAVDTSYRAACVSKSREQFIAHISAVARHAKRARTLLLDLVQANHLSIELARELILDARGFERIFAAARNTARRRRAIRAVRSTT
jgi:hypothetical protein